MSRDAADLWTRLANDIRAVDGNHDLGAGELAHRLVERGWTLVPAASEPVRAVIRIRTPDDEAPSWTARGDLVPGLPYSYVSGDVAVVVDWLHAPLASDSETT